MFVTFPVATPPTCPVLSFSLTYTAPLLLLVCLFVAVQALLSVLVSIVYPLAVVLAVAVTFPFVHPLGLYVKLTFAVVKSGTFCVFVVLATLIFPAWSLTHT